MSLLYTSIQKKSKWLKDNPALLLLIASLSLLALFAGKVYFENNDSSIQAIDTKRNIQVIDNNSQNNVVEINDLTAQLLTERQITEDFHTENQELIQRLQKTTTNLNISDRNYLSSLKALNNIKEPYTSNNKTDYYNKVSLNSDKENTLQNQINQFIDMNNKEENIYFDTLKVESYIRQNEIH